MGVFNNGGPAPVTCPALPSPVTDAAPIVGSLTFTQLSHWLTGISALVSLITIGGLVMMHTMNMTRPAEQIRIIRIISIAPVFAALSWGSTYLGVNYMYLVVWQHFTESIAMASFFQLVCIFGQQRPAPFLPIPNRGFEQLSPEPRPSKPVVPTSIMQYLVLQYVPMTILIGVITCITQSAGVFCANSTNIHFAHLWTQIIQSLSVAVAAMTVIRFTRISSPKLPQYKLMTKLVSFKLLIGVEFIQTLVFSLASDKFTPSATFAYADLAGALPAVILGFELVAFSFVWVFTFSYQPFVNPNGRRSVSVGALIEAYNPLAVVRDLFMSLY